MRATAYTVSTVNKAVKKAASGTAINPQNEYGHLIDKAITAPSPAPDATPIKYGSASGLRKSPWYAAPLIPSAAPVSATSTVRGRRIFHKMELDISTPFPISEFHISCGGRNTEPIAMLRM